MRKIKFITFIISALVSFSVMSSPLGPFNVRLKNPRFYGGLFLFDENSSNLGVSSCLVHPAGFLLSFYNLNILI